MGDLLISGYFFPEQHISIVFSQANISYSIFSSHIVAYWPYFSPKQIIFEFINYFTRKTLPYAPLPIFFRSLNIWKLDLFGISVKSTFCFSLYFFGKCFRQSFVVFDRTRDFPSDFLATGSIYDLFIFMASSLMIGCSKELNFSVIYEWLNSKGEIWVLGKSNSIISS